MYKLGGEPWTLGNLVWIKKIIKKTSLFRHLGTPELKSECQNCPRCKFFECIVWIIKDDNNKALYQMCLAINRGQLEIYWFYIFLDTKIACQENVKVALGMNFESLEWIIKDDHIRVLYWMSLANSGYLKVYRFRHRNWYQHVKIALGANFKTFLFLNKDNHTSALSIKCLNKNAGKLPLWQQQANCSKKLCEKSHHFFLLKLR